MRIGGTASDRRARPTAPAPHPAERAGRRHEERDSRATPMPSASPIGPISHSIACARSGRVAVRARRRVGIEMRSFQMRSIRLPRHSLRSASQVLSWIWSVERGAWCVALRGAGIAASLPRISRLARGRRRAGSGQAGGQTWQKDGFSSASALPRAARAVGSVPLRACSRARQQRPVDPPPPSAQFREPMR